MSRPGDELAELLWDNGPALRTTPLFPPAPLFQPFTCSAADSSRAHELDKRHHAGSVVGAMDDFGLGGGIPVHHHHHHHDAVPWLHCPVIDDGDSDTAPLPPEYCAGLLSGYSGLHAVPEPDPTTPSITLPPSNGGAVTTQPQPSGPSGGEAVMNFTFFSRPLQRPQASPSNHPEPTVVQTTAASRLRNTPLFSEQRMAWLQPPKGPRGANAAASPAPHHAPPPATDHHRQHADQAPAATVTQKHRLQPDARAPDGTTSSVCSGNGDRSQARRSSSHQQPTTAECSVSQDVDVDDEPGAARTRSAARGTKRSRPAEVHNLSERRRRDRINEKMRALQELIPNCNKIDKASMLEEAIEYLKTLQLQVQMMSMGGAGAGLCVPPPMLMQMMQLPHHPMAPPFAHHLAMGLGFGMGAAFDMLPRFAGAHHQFPCPAVMPGGAAPHQMAMPPHASMFGMMPPFLHVNGAAEQREAAAPVVPVAPQQGDPKQT